MTDDQNTAKIEETINFFGDVTLTTGAFDSDRTHLMCAKSVLHGMTRKKSTVRVGRVEVSYREVRKGKVIRWVVSDYRSGRRVLRSAVSETAAREKALDIARDIVHGRTATKDMTAAESLAWDNAKRQLAACCATVDDAVRFYLRLGPGAVKRTALRVAVDAFLAAQKPKVDAFLAAQKPKVVAKYHRNLTALT